MVWFSIYIQTFSLYRCPHSSSSSALVQWKHVWGGKRGMRIENNDTATWKRSEQHDVMRTSYLKPSSQIEDYIDKQFKYWQMMIMQPSHGNYLSFEASTWPNQQQHTYDLAWHETSSRHFQRVPLHDTTALRRRLCELIPISSCNSHPWFQGVTTPSNDNIRSCRENTSKINWNL